MSLTVVTAPAVEPVEIDALRAHLRVDTLIDDDVIHAALAAARRHVEAFTGRALIDTVFDLRLDAFPEVVRLPVAPVSTVTSVKYIDSDGAEQTLASSEWTADIYAAPARLVPAWAKTWPATRAEPNAVTVRFTAGYGAGPAAVPEDLRAALKLLAGDLYENREAQFTSPTPVVENPTVRALLWPFKIWWL